MSSNEAPIYLSPPVGAHCGVEDLTDRELEVLRLIAGGWSNLAIAERLFVTERTVEAHVRAIFMKLGLFPAAREHRRVRAALAYHGWDAGLELLAA